MQFYSDSKDIKFTEAMKSYAEEKISKLSKHFDVDGARFSLKKEGLLIKLEISLPGNVRSSKSGEDYYSLLLEVISQIESQVKKSKSVKSKKVSLKNQDPLIWYEETEIKEYKIREKVVPTEEMYKEEAIEKMELLGHSFFVFVDLEGKRTSVVYKRNDGDYGCLILI
jgi:putative sigma-54 modulation protein